MCCLLSFLLPFLLLPSLLAAPRKETGASSRWRYTPPAFAPVGKALSLTGQIPNNDDIDEVFFYSRVIGEITYKVRPMTLERGEYYTAAFPAEAVKPPGIEYYIVAIDTKKKRLALFASAQKPRRLLFRAAEDRKDPDNEPSLPSASDGETVFGAGRREQQIQRAPGVVTVITETEIKAGGWRDVVDLLRWIVGIDINNNGLSPDIGIRGVNPGLTFGDKIVLLIDGHNMSWRQLNRNATFLNIDNVKRIEVIRGPGSTLWGANALSGVINIITKTGQDLKGFDGVVGGSPLSGIFFTTLQGGSNLIGGLNFRASFGLLRDNRGPRLAPIYEFAKMTDADYKLLNERRAIPGLTYERALYYPREESETNQYFQAHLSWRGFTLSFYQNHLDATLPINSFSILGTEGARLIADRYIGRLSWLGSLGSWGTLLVWGAYDYYGFSEGSQYEANGFSPFESSSTYNGTVFHAFTVTDSPTSPPKAVYPICDYLPPNVDVPCIKLTGRLGAAGAEKVCKVVASKTKDVPTLLPPDEPEVYPIPAQCRPYTQGKYKRRLEGADHRAEAGILLSAQFPFGLSFNVGFDFEYLYLVQTYFPELWPLLGLDTPLFSNIHASAFLQLQYNLRDFIEFTAGFRADYDQIYGFVATPRAAAVLTPGLGFFVKALYGNAFRAPSFQDLYYFRKDETYGNPSSRPETVHTFELQVGWHRNRLLALSVNGYVSLFRNLLGYQSVVSRSPGQGESTFLTDDYKVCDAQIRNACIPASQLPTLDKPVQQKLNRGELITYGGEVELRLFPIPNLNIRGSFGLFFGQYDDSRPLEYAATWTGSLTASYRYRFFQASLGVLVVGPKKVPPRAVVMPGILPGNRVEQGKSLPMPAWTNETDIAKRNAQGLPFDPSTETPLYVQTYVTLQFLEILNHLDIVIRASNLLNLDIYDASDLLFTPQKRFDLMMWLRVRY